MLLPKPLDWNPRELPDLATQDENCEKKQLMLPDSNFSQHAVHLLSSLFFPTLSHVKKQAVAK